ncbi:hypothetical protein [Pyrobaculum sp.]|uniref:hypothetical protein n=1 Tax=Pyrobaculum sp. TaxID=2004705 RepID=UPI003D0E4770
MRSARLDLKGYRYARLDFKDYEERLDAAAYPRLVARERRRPQAVSWDESVLPVYEGALVRNQVTTELQHTVERAIERVAPGLGAELGFGPIEIVYDKVAEVELTAYKAMFGLEVADAQGSTTRPRRQLVLRTARYSPALHPVL